MLGHIASRAFRVHGTDLPLPDVVLVDDVVTTTRLMAGSCGYQRPLREETHATWKPLCVMDLLIRLA